MSGSGLSACVILLVIWQVPVIAAGVYRCNITGDPHLETFTGQSASLAIPCAYLVTRLRLTNSLHQAGVIYPEIQVEVVGGNTQRAVNGRYYVTDMFVRILYNATTESLTNTFFTGESLISSNTPWTSQSNETMQGRVQLSFDPGTKAATLTITNTTLTVRFVPATRSQGNLQHIRPGIFIEVEDTDLIWDSSIQFPQTMCSTVNDTTSIAVHRQFQGLPHRFMGLFAVLGHMQYNIPSGDQDNLCPALMGKFKLCDNAYKKTAFMECFGLMRTPEVVDCFGTHFNNTPVTFATDACLDYHCSASAPDCLQLRQYNATCSRVGTIVNLAACAP